MILFRHKDHFFVILHEAFILPSSCAKVAGSKKAFVIMDPATSFHFVQDDKAGVQDDGVMREDDRHNAE